MNFIWANQSINDQLPAKEVYSPHHAHPRIDSLPKTGLTIFGFEKSLPLYSVDKKT